MFRADSAGEHSLKKHFRLWYMFFFFYFVLFFTCLFYFCLLHLFCLYLSVVFGFVFFFNIWFEVSFIVEQSDKWQLSSFSPFLKLILSLLPL